MNINATLLVQMATFAFFIWFTMKFLWPPFMTMLKERQDRISQGLDAARKGEEFLAQARKDSHDLVLEAREKAEMILRRAQERSEKLISDAQETAHKEAQALVEKGRLELELESRRLKEALTDEVAALAVATAGKILRREVDESTHRGLVVRALEGDQ